MKGKLVGPDGNPDSRHAMSGWETGPTTDGLRAQKNLAEQGAPRGTKKKEVVGPGKACNFPNPDLDCNRRPTPVKQKLGKIPNFCSRHTSDRTTAPRLSKRYNPSCRQILRQITQDPEITHFTFDVDLPANYRQGGR